MNFNKQTTIAKTQILVNPVASTSQLNGQQESKITVTRQSIEKHLRLLTHTVECNKNAEQNLHKCTVACCKMMKECLKHMKKDNKLINFSVSYGDNNVLSPRRRAHSHNQNNSTVNIGTNAPTSNVLVSAPSTSRNIPQDPPNLIGQSAALHLNEQSSNFLCIHLNESSFSNSDARIFYQQQLLQLLHVFKCQKREKDNPNGKKCSLPFCKTLREVLSHMNVCKANTDCTVPYCATTKFILPHWENCVSFECPVCQPLSYMKVKTVKDLQE